MTSRWRTAYGSQQLTSGMTALACWLSLTFRVACCGHETMCLRLPRRKGTVSPVATSRRRLCSNVRRGRQLLACVVVIWPLQTLVVSRLERRRQGPLCSRRGGGPSVARRPRAIHMPSTMGLVSGQRASTRPEAWRIADEAERADEASPSRTPAPPGSAQADNPPSARGRGRSAPRSAQRSSQQLSSGPVPLNVTDLARHQTFMQRPSMRRAPTARHR